MAGVIITGDTEVAMTNLNEFHTRNPIRLWVLFRYRGFRQIILAVARLHVRVVVYDCFPTMALFCCRYTRGKNDTRNRG